MLRFLQRPDIPFSREDVNRYLPWVIAVMVCLASLLMAAGISLHSATLQSGQLNVHSFQVYIPFAKRGDAVIKDVSLLLESQERVRQFRQLPADEIGQLIQPWTSDALPMDELPLPVIFEATLTASADRAEAIAEITRQLQAIDPDLEVESYQEWVDQLTQFTKMLRLGVFLLVGMLLAALMVLVAVVVRSSLMLNFQTVRLLHHVGARDAYIVQQFVTNGCLLVLKGSAMGMGLASMIAVAVSYLSRQWASPLLPALDLTALHVVALIGLPLLLVGLSALLVRATILRLLEHMH